MNKIDLSGFLLNICHLSTPNGYSRRPTAPQTVERDGNRTGNKGKRMTKNGRTQTTPVPAVLSQVNIAWDSAQ